MRICLFTPSFLPKTGGMEIVLDKLARQFQAAGHDVTVVAKTPRGETPRPALPYPTVYYRRSRSQVWLLGPARRALLREHARRRFDVVHAHQAYPTGYTAVKARARLGVPVVITSHKGDVIPESRYRQRWIPRRRMLWALAQADAVTGVSAELKQIIDELSGGRARSVVIPNGVDIAVQPPGDPPARFADLAGGSFILTLGRLHRHKGLDVLLDALALLRARDEEPPPLVIAGDGKERSALAGQAERLGLADIVSLVGAVYGPEKSWLLANCRFLCQPSRAEGMPLTVLEAMAAGKAVLGTDVSGIRELVAPGRTGLLVPGESAEDLARGIERLSGDPDGLARLSANALARAEDYSWENVAQRYIALYESVLS